MSYYARLSTFLSCFRRKEDGVAFLEFALAAPMLMTLLLGTIEMTRYILITQKTEKTASTIADVVAQGTTISNADLSNIIYASTQVMLPYTMGANGCVIISSVTQTGAYNASNPPRVNWQYTSSGANGSLSCTTKVGTPLQAATLPAGFTLYDKDNIIITEMFYTYTPLLAQNGVVSTTLIYRTSLFKPRLGALNSLSALPFWTYAKELMS